MRADNSRSFLFVDFVVNQATKNNLEKIVKEMTVEKIKSLSNKYLDTNKMIWLVAGDTKTQLEPFKKLGFGYPVLLNQAAKAF